MRVLFVSCDPLGGAVTRYRCTHLAEALKSAGHTADVATIYDPVIRLEHDIVVLHRICANTEGQGLADAVRKSGATLIYGADDLVWEAISPASSLGHPSSPVAPSSREEGLASLHLAMLQQADGVLVSTNALAEFAQEAGAKEAAVVRNWALEKELQSEPLVADQGKFTLFYGAGTRTHDRDIALLVPALEELLTTGRYEEQLVLAGRVGCPVELLRTGRVKRWPWCEWKYYVALTHGCDTVLAPLEATRFNSGKSELKWLEAAMCKKPTVASFWGGFREVIADGKDGFLAENPEEWQAKILQLMEDNRLRARMGKAAYASAKKQASEQQKATVAVFQSWQPSRVTVPRLVRNYWGWLKGKVKTVQRRLKR